MRSRRTSTVRFRFRDGSGDLPDLEVSELRFALGSLHAAHRLGLDEGVASACAALIEVAREVRAKIELTYSTEEIRKGVTGGWPGLKEILLYCVLRKCSPKTVLETGVAQGVSSRFALQALEMNGSGRLTSIDLRRRAEPIGLGQDHTFVKPELETGWLVPTRLKKLWTLLEGPSERLLGQQHGPIDVFCHDSLHTYEHMRFEFEWARAHLSPRGVLISDDIRWNHAFRDFIRAHRDSVWPVCTRDVGLAVLVV